MPVFVKRKYICHDCSHTWRSDKLVERGTAPEKCPRCKVPDAAEVVERPRDRDLRAGPLAVRAADFTYKMAESDYGMTDMRDNLRQGDLAMKIPANPVGDQVQKQGGMFGMAGSGNALSHAGNAGALAAGARAERQKQGIADPVMGLQSAIKSANAPSVIDRARRGDLGIRAK